MDKSNSDEAAGIDVLYQLEQYRTKVVEQDITIFEMRALLQSGKGLGNIMNVKILLDTFMAVVREKYGATTSAVLLRDDLDPAVEYYQVKAFHGLKGTFREPKTGEDESLFLFKFPQDQGLLWNITKQGNVFSVSDKEKKPRFGTAWKRWGLEVLKSDIWCPLIKNGNVLGVLTLGCREDGTQIPEAQFGFLQELASIATANIDSTLKYEKNERILRNIQTLYDVNQQIANVNDFKRLCIEALSTAVEAVHAQKGNLMLLNKLTNQLELKVVWGSIPERVRDEINSGSAETTTIPVGEGIAGRCASSMKPLRANERDKIPQIGKFTAHCMLAVPVIYSNELQGVITMTNKVVPGSEGETKALDPLGRFTAEDEALLLGLADQAATNLHKTRLYSASITDRMTELFNTRHFEMMLAEEFDKSLASGKPMCLAVSDIDHFKKFNDTYGHKAGDEVLKVVAKIFAGCVRTGKQDIVFRYGGEEYCMIMPETTPEEAMAVIEDYRRKVEEAKLDYEGKELKVKVSVGIAASLLDTSSVKEIFKLADDCLYACKENGRNQVRAWFGGHKVRFDAGMAPGALTQLYQTKPVVATKPSEEPVAAESPVVAMSPAAAAALAAATLPMVVIAPPADPAKSDAAVAVKDESTPKAA